MSDGPPAVHVHVHRVMAGAFPLRVADLLFTDDTLVVPEYRYLTPLSGILRDRHAVGAAAAERYREAGIGGLVEMAERTHRIAYADIELLRIYDGRFVGRPKVAIDVLAGPPYAYRVHAPVDVTALTDALASLGRRRGYAVERHGALGFDPYTSLRRFLADR
ncbi:hypothetical protein [Halococcus sp. PRR34]|uniref:hypothetical protein n=1 Tax=Halococcus sp. PRR34 TaxID=3020830 RepID=UPI00235E45A7|nr:hypothetical protein [Halococcus sp. PRR34]